MTRTALIPFYSMEKAPDRFSLTLPWPVGVTRTVDHQKDYREWGIPWPIITCPRGRQKGHTHGPCLKAIKAPINKKGFVAWPLLRFQNKRDTVSVKNINKYSFTLQAREETQRSNDEVMRERWSLWPLFIKERKNEITSTQWMAPLEAILWNKETIQRHYSPLWAIWRSQKTRYLVGMSDPSYGMSGARIDHRKEMSPLCSSDCSNTKNPLSKSHWSVFGRPIGPSSNTPDFIISLLFDERILEA